VRFGEFEELLADSRVGVERAIAIVSDMRELAQGSSPHRDPVDVNELVAGVVRMAATQRGSGSIAERYVALPPVVGNAGQLRQVFLNLVVNALQAAGTAGSIEIETGTERGGVLVRVRDDGPGIAAEHRERLFVPFFTTKPAGEGTGLGLYISYQIVRGHGGEIRVDSQPGAGATFSVWLPGGAGGGEAQADEPTASVPAPGAAGREAEAA
jgi:signal transduction histidine kinase